MKINLKSSIAAMCTCTLLMSTNVFALNGTVSNVKASYTEAYINVSGNTSDCNNVIIEVWDSNKSLYGSYEMSVMNNSFNSSVFAGAIPEGDYTVKIADLEGGSYAVTSLTVSNDDDDDNNNNGNNGNSGGSSGGGGGGSSNKAAVAVNKTKKETKSKITQNSGGKVTLSEDGKTVTIKPDNGYIIKDVIINGESVGMVETYTFEEVKDDDTIKVVFEKIQTTPTTPSSPKFNDISGHWASEYIIYLTDKGIVNGMTDTAFSPNSNLTRAQFVQMLSGIAKPDLTKYNSSSFADVNSSDWFAKSVAWANDIGITSGVDGNNFAPNSNITREQIAAMLVRFADKMNYTLDSSSEVIVFKDESLISAYAIDSIEKMQKAGIISGRPDGSFGPKDNATRAEVCRMLYVLLQQIES